MSDEEQHMMDDPNLEDGEQFEGEGEGQEYYEGDPNEQMEGYYDPQYAEEYGHAGEEEMGEYGYEGEENGEQMHEEGE